MKSVRHIRDFLDEIVGWFSTQEDVQAVALVGSYAREEAREDSDIDLVILTDHTEKYLEGFVWVKQFGEIEKHQTEDYGKLTSVRVWYRDCYEVEYGITTPDWAAQPLDPGTRQVISDGMQVLFERSPLLSPHTKY
jgi:predicted nucleotidyltransferase